jgi:Ran GTPase-activating protein (RanGAP) involved in mRNA processing and transport
MFCAVTGAILLAGGLIAWSTTVKAKLMSACLIWGTSKITKIYTLTPHIRKKGVVFTLLFEFKYTRKINLISKHDSNLEQFTKELSSMLQDIICMWKINGLYVYV